LGSASGVTCRAERCDVAAACTSVDLTDRLFGPQEPVGVAVRRVSSASARFAASQEQPRIKQQNRTGSLQRNSRRMKESSLSKSRRDRLDRRYLSCCSTKPTYPELGGTREDLLPAGYDHLYQRVRVGCGDETFGLCRAALRDWTPQRAAGITVYPSDVVPHVGKTVLLVWRFGPFRIFAPCRIVWTVDDPDRTGFGYGTLPGHPEQGEESFTVEKNAAGDVWFVVRAFSRPATWFARLGAPITRRIQESIIDAYTQALRATGGGS
jgi:uncharacterized protein (UPF0548 family)